MPRRLARGGHRKSTELRLENQFTRGARVFLASSPEVHAVEHVRNDHMAVKEIFHRDWLRGDKSALAP